MTVHVDGKPVTKKGSTKGNVARLRQQFEASLEEKVEVEADRRQQDARDERVSAADEALRERFEDEVLELAIEEVNEQEVHERFELEEKIERELRAEFEKAHGLIGAVANG